MGIVVNDELYSRALYSTGIANQIEQIMEYAANGNLRAHLKALARPLSWRVKRRLCIDVARGLEYLHTRTPQPVVHGDLKVRTLLVVI
jgi:serine/threonine protein kinase